MSDLAIIILTYNEALHIARALDHIKPIAKQIFVVDSYSNDDTVAIAQAYGAIVLQHPFVNHAKQFQWAMDHAPVDAAWVMRLDADEIIEADLAREIAQKLPQLPAAVSGVNLRRKTIFQNRWIRFGGRYPLTLLRIWRRGTARIEDRWMDEHMVLESGTSVCFSGGFADHNLNGLTYFTDKHNKYATREAVDVINQRLHLFDVGGGDAVQMSSSQAAFKRFVKERIYNRTPQVIAAFGYFLYRYFIQLGFLDGREGLVYHVLQGFWYRFLVGAKVRELNTAIAGLTDKDEIKKRLTAETGLQI
jgi:glycosyltransferase involved in cell wall biosynthesis